jgi:hypothetical protein
MTDLEGRLAASDWADAPAELKDIAELRERYDGAVKGRAAAQQKARDAREKRNAEKQRFLLTYAEIAHRVQAEFPRDKEMQDLFFDDVRIPSLASEADSEEANTDEELEPVAAEPAGDATKPAER